MATYESRISNELPGEPQEGLLKVVVGLCRDIVVLQVLLAMKGDGLGLHLSLLDIDFVAAEDNGDALADTDKITCADEEQIESAGASIGRIADSGPQTYGASWEHSCK